MKHFTNLPTPTLAAVLLVACANLASGATFFASSRDGDDLESLCRNKTINLSKLSHLDKLIQKLEDDYGGECLDNTEAALRDLKELVDQNKRKECSLEAYERYRDFYLRYLDTSDEEKMKTFAKLPKSLRDFALAYGVQVASLCRTNMVNRLLEDAQRAISVEDFEEVAELIDEKGPISMALGYTGDKPDEMVLPGDFLAIMSEATREKMALKVQAAPLIKRIMALCERRFEPVYEPLMIPVAKLANLGFDHRRGVLRDAIQAALQNEHTKGAIGNWTRVAFMCEIMNEFEIIEEQSDRERAGDNDATQVHVLTRADAAELKARGGVRNLLDDLDNTAGRRLDQINFKPSLWIDMPDVILATKKQKSGVALVNTNRNENANIRRRFLVKVLKRLWRDLSRMKTSAFFGSLFRELKDLQREGGGANGQQAEPSKDLIASLNDIVDRRFNPDKAVCQSEGCSNMRFLITFVVVAIICFGAMYHFGVFSGGAITGFSIGGG